MIPGEICTNWIERGMGQSEKFDQGVRSLKEVNPELYMMDRKRKVPEVR